MLPEQDWLAQAKRLAIGMKIRTRHRNEARANLVIANEADKWWSYCQRCHEGGVVLKDHVRFGEALAVHDATPYMPEDAVLVYGSEYEVPVERFLASKNMSSEYLPRLKYSPSRKRIIVPTHGNQWHGRDVTGKAPSKWMNYGTDQVAGVTDLHTVVVEDIFSMYKVLWASRHAQDVGVLCALGTAIKPAVVQRLMHCKTVIWMFDADTAGDDGAAAGRRALLPFVQNQTRVRPPAGLDPKDMKIDDIQEALYGKS
jgi:hypothetical protein